MTRHMCPPRLRPKPESWMRCCLCGIAQRVRDMDQVGPNRWVCSEAAGTPLCCRLRREVGIARSDPLTSPTTQPQGGIR